MKGDDADIARRALRLLAERKVAPTPHSFSDAFYELSGAKAAGATPAALLKDVVRDFVKSERLPASEASTLSSEIQSSHWMAVRAQFDQILTRKPGTTAANWPLQTLALLRALDALHPGWTRGRKLEAVVRVIEGAADQPEAALARLMRLMSSWGKPAPARDDQEVPTKQSLTATDAVAGLQEATTMQGPSVALKYGSDPALQAGHDQAWAAAQAWKRVALRAARLLALACGPSSLAANKLSAYIAQNEKQDAREGEVGNQSQPDKIAPKFVDLVAVIERDLDEEHKVRMGLQRLLSMLCDNVKTLAPDEVWLAGQLEPIRALLMQSEPIAHQAIDQAQSQLAQVIAAQEQARRGLMEAKTALRQMLSTLVERIGSMSSTAGNFYEQVGGYQKALETATDFETLSQVIAGLLHDTAAVRSDMDRSRAELAHARKKAEDYEARVVALEQELSEVSSLVQKDPLTFALNRRGLDEVFRLETARAQRYGAPLSAAIIDIDDFKRVNDHLGHAAGDRALVHLATTLRAVLQPTDVIARLGGEEFAVLLPATDAEGAQQACERLLKELAKRPFVWDGVVELITFSAGVCQWQMGESLEDLLQRADRTMYLAKHAGKNRVVSSP